MANFKLIDIDKIIGKNKSAIFKKYGTEAAITDFAILLGGYTSNNEVVYNKKNRKLLSSPWWTDSKEPEEEKLYVTCKNYAIDHAPEQATQIGIRPYANYNEIIKDNIIDYSIKDKTGTEEIKYGEYPQWIVDEEQSKKLEALYNLRVLFKTGKEYINYPEYNYNGVKYIRIVSNENSFRTLSNERKVRKNEIYWLKVSSITWIVNKYENSMLSKYIIASGISYKNIKDFLYNSFSKQIEKNKIITPSQEKQTYMEELIKVKQALLDIENICKNENDETIKEAVLKKIKQTTIK